MEVVATDTVTGRRQFSSDDCYLQQVIREELHITNQRQYPQCTLKDHSFQWEVWAVRGQVCSPPSPTLFLSQRKAWFLNPQISSIVTGKKNRPLKLQRVLISVAEIALPLHLRLLVPEEREANYKLSVLAVLKSIKRKGRFFKKLFSGDISSFILIYLTCLLQENCLSISVQV